MINNIFVTRDYKGIILSYMYNENTSTHRLSSLLGVYVGGYYIYISLFVFFQVMHYILC